MQLHRFPHSGYARFVQAVLDLARIRYELHEVAYGDRDALATLTGGSIQVPVVVTDDGTVLTDSSAIVAALTERAPAVAALAPAADAGPIWAYVGWAGQVLEDVAFRLASPGIALRFTRPFERALFVFTKERKFGAGCVDAWARDEDALAAQLRRLIQPTATTLATRRFVVGDEPTLADAALYGQLVMIEFGAPVRLAELPPAIHAWRARLEERMGGSPYGARARRQPTLAELDTAAPDPRPRSGRLELIVIRTAADQRACPDQVTLTAGGGLAGDRWAGGRADAEVSLMDARMAAVVADPGDWPLFGDNLLVDLDLSSDAVAPGDRIIVGDVVLVATAYPHLGCRKYMARFGADALQWVNARSERHRRRRGLYARIERGGVIRTGDRARVAR